MYFLGARIAYHRLQLKTALRPKECPEPQRGTGPRDRGCVRSEASGRHFRRHGSVPGQTAADGGERAAWPRSLGRRRVPAQLHQSRSSRGLPSATGLSKEDHLRGAVAAAKGRAKREKKVAQSAAQPRQGRDKDLEPDARDACAGIATQATLHSITLSILSSSPSSSTEFNGMLLKHTSRFHQGGGWRSPAGRSKINFHVAVSAAPAPLGCTSQPKWPRGTVVRAPLCRSLLVSWEHCPAGQ